MRFAVAFLALGFLLPSLAAAEGGRVDEARYAGGASARPCTMGYSTPPLTPAEGALFQGLGSACFPLDGTETAFALAVVDDLAGAVPALISFWGSTGTVVAQHHACSGSLDGSVPAGSLHVDVMVHGPSNSVLNCGLLRPATTGVIRVEWS